MENLCELIETHLRCLLEAAANGTLELRRSELAGRFGCSPSQINYVLETRFTVERGYLVESRRGGRGFIRISRLEWESPLDLLLRTYLAVTDQISQAAADDLVLRLQHEGAVSQREAGLMRAAIAREVLALELPHRDRVRSRLLRSMLVCLLRERAKNESLPRGVLTPGEAGS